MSRGIQRAKVDGNHADIVSALRKAGIAAHSGAAIGKGFPDVVAGFRGVNVLLEIKQGDRDCDRKLTGDESKWHESWSGQVAVVSTPTEAITAVISHCKQMGVL